MPFLAGFGHLPLGVILLIVAFVILALKYREEFLNRTIEKSAARSTFFIHKNNPKKQPN